jgi:8-oxo-dGTP pyrophosphatase MutT (NUDIX family)
LTGRRDFQLVSQEVRFEGAVIRAGSERFRYADGTEVLRDKVWHPGAVAILPVDSTHVWLTRQPREVILQPDSLEIPAGKRDVPGEPPLDTAKRELAEEIGKRAANWREILDFFPTSGFADEHIHLYLATGLSQAPAVPHAQEDERIEVVPWPLAQLDAAIAATRDAKSLIALLWLSSQRGRRSAWQTPHA